MKTPYNVFSKMLYCIQSNKDREVGKSQVHDSERFLNIEWCFSKLFMCVVE